MISRQVQTSLRESETQTHPFEPELKGESTSDLLLLTFLDHDKCDKLDTRDLELFERARHVRQLTQELKGVPKDDLELKKQRLEALEKIGFDNFLQDLEREGYLNSRTMKHQKQLIQKQRDEVNRKRLNRFCINSRNKLKEEIRNMEHKKSKQLQKYEKQERILQKLTKKEKKERARISSFRSGAPPALPENFKANLSFVGENSATKASDNVLVELEETRLLSRRDKNLWAHLDHLDQILT